MHPFIALTDQAWFDHLASCAENGVVDEVNFWSPRSLRPMKILSPGEPVFLRLKSPYSAIAGYGFFAHHCVLDLREAWDFFGWKNGDPDEANFLRRIGGYRSKDLLALHAAREQLGCTILRNRAARRRSTPTGSSWKSRPIVNQHLKISPACSCRWTAMNAAS